jgi:hypothetical protein
MGDGVRNSVARPEGSAPTPGEFARIGVVVADSGPEARDSVSIEVSNHW